MLETATPLLSLLPLVFGRQESLEHREQERSESAALRIDGKQKFLFEQSGKELLCQILGVLGRVTVAPYKSIEGIPIGLAQRFQGLLGIGG